MAELPFTGTQFDAIWAEGSAYIMGFENAIRSWCKFIKPQGFLVVSDLVWITTNPMQEASAFWHQNYPEMKHIDAKLSSISELGLRLLRSFPLSHQAWENYLAPLRERIVGLSLDDYTSNALADLKKELDIHKNHLGEYGYQMFVLQKQS